MKVTIKIEFNNSNYNHVKTILEALQQSVDRFDAIYENEPNGKVRTIKGRPQFDEGKVEL